MTPLHFEQMYQDEWAELEASLARVLGRACRSVRHAFAGVRRSCRVAVQAHVRTSRACARTLVPGVHGRSTRACDRRRPSADLSPPRIRYRAAPDICWPSTFRRRSGCMRRYVCGCRGDVRAADGRDGRARVCAAGTDPLSRQFGYGLFLRDDVFTRGSFDRPDAHCDDRLDDVRLLHSQQRERRVPVLRGRTVCRPRVVVLPCLQRRVLRCARRIPDRTRAFARRSIRSSRLTLRSS